MTNERPPRADAARNRARVLAAAYEAFASEGLSVSLDEIARRAGVGAGTVHRHFPAKVDLASAVIRDRLTTIVEEGRSLLETDGPAALFAFTRLLVLEWGAADRGLRDALAALGADINSVIPEGMDTFLKMLDELLATAQQAGVVRPDIDARGMKAILVGCQAMREFDPERAPALLDTVIDGLRVKA
ncbi:TetR/AcrR family transcriptional regulator [Mycobacterium branderi]|uniref:TetR family transcriptional regulator n=1 Tax=Mycobacterium branderi TaxID=43348 RepID=A0A7I7W2W7_9MYCO|nr:TetR/AcrR family transcriptional regulator [Mycobacterium branderi]MCV7235049.1 helix-turn-helix transcriptional regulator [Mycobacterium branderi]ORA36721.1 TetR family transcriptional regulator [Mycobacterium branderi]BBZ11317.1 TetR family transcriptional regulator [Mycobacterium branderi]